MFRGSASPGAPVRAFIPHIPVRGFIYDVKSGPYLLGGDIRCKPIILLLCRQLLLVTKSNYSKHFQQVTGFVQYTIAVRLAV